MCMKTWRPSEAYHFPCACDGTRWALWTSKDSNQKGLWDRENSVAVSLESLNWLNEEGEGERTAFVALLGHGSFQALSHELFYFYTNWWKKNHPLSWRKLELRVSILGKWQNQEPYKNLFDWEQNCLILMHACFTFAGTEQAGLWVVLLRSGDCPVRLRPLSLHRLPWPLRW